MEDSNNTEHKKGVVGSIERLVAMTLWQLMKNHTIDYLMTFEITPGTESRDDVIIRVPKWEGIRPILDGDRNLRIADALQFLQESCYPGKFFTDGHAAKVNTGTDEKGAYIKVSRIGKGNRGTDALWLVMARQFRDEAQRKSLGHTTYNR